MMHIYFLGEIISPECGHFMWITVEALLSAKILYYFGCTLEMLREEQFQAIPKSSLCPSDVPIFAV